MEESVVGGFIIGTTDKTEKNNPPNNPRPLKRPGFFCLSLRHNTYQQLTLFNGDNDRRIRPKSRRCQPVALEVQAGGFGCNSASSYCRLRDAG